LEISATTAAALATVFVPLRRLGRIHIVIFRDIHKGMVFATASTSVAISSSAG
jgi:hypothetical protein